MLSLAAMALSLALAIVLSVVQASGNRAFIFLVRTYISYMRGTPLLVQILLVYYAWPQLGISLPPIAAGILALGLSSSAFTAEILRGGIAAIPRGQIDAAQSLGMRPPSVWIGVIIPQLYQLTLPPLVNEFTQVIKGSPLVSVITVVETMRIAQQIYNANFRPLEVLIGVAIVFFTMIFVLVRLAAHLERRNVVKRG